MDYNERGSDPPENPISSVSDLETIDSADSVTARRVSTSLWAMSSAAAYFHLGPPGATKRYRRG